MTSLESSSVHSGTVTAFFDTRDAANKAVDSLLAAGISRDHISVTSETAGSETAKAEYDKGFWQSLKDLFMPEEDRFAYAEGLRRGGTIVSVRTTETDYDRALEILDAEGSVNLDEREATWRNEGWMGYQPSNSEAGLAASATSAPAAPRPTVPPAASVAPASSQPMTNTAAASAQPMGTAAPTSTAAGQPRSSSAEKDEAIPVYEEQLRVGKRDVNHGRVRVRSYVVEKPVSEQVNLRNENVQVERKPVDRPVGAADAVFQDRVIEAEEHAEEAIVGKEARVKEEITLKKDADQRTQTVSDTVRQTKVDVEDQRVPGTTRPPAP
jgi:uncharacterized protein (TIGR02271 family)